MFYPNFSRMLVIFVAENQAQWKVVVHFKYVTHTIASVVTGRAIRIMLTSSNDAARRDDVSSDV
jgi:hypothetical protein